MVGFWQVLGNSRVMTNQIPIYELDLGKGVGGVMV